MYSKSKILYLSEGSQNQFHLIILKIALTFLINCFDFIYLEFCELWLFLTSNWP